MRFNGVWGPLTLLSSAALFFNAEWKKTFEGLGELDFSRWWALMPIAVLVVVALLKTNYEKFVLIEAAKREAETARQKQQAAKDEALVKVSQLERELTEKPPDPPLILDQEEGPRYTGLLVRNRSSSRSAVNVSMKEIVGSAHKLVSDRIGEIRPGEVARLPVHSASLEGRTASPAEKFMAPDAFLEERVKPSGKAQISVELNYTDFWGTAYVSESDVEWSKSTGGFRVSRVTFKKVSRAPSVADAPSKG